MTQEEFNKDPWKVINNSNLAIKYENHIYTWKVIAPLILSQLFYAILNLNLFPSVCSDYLFLHMV